MVAERSMVMCEARNVGVHDKTEVTVSLENHGQGRGGPLTWIRTFRSTDTSSESIVTGLGLLTSTI